MERQPDARRALEVLHFAQCAIIENSTTFDGAVRSWNAALTE